MVHETIYSMVINFYKRIYSQDFMDNDQELIAKANIGDEQAMFALYENHKNFCYNLANRYLLDSSEAEDVLQETFKYLFSKFPGFILTCQLRTFLFPVVRNLCLTRLRKRKNFVSSELLDKEEAKEQRTPEIDRQKVIEIIAQLGQEHQEVLLLRFADQLSLEEIAEKLSIPQGTVKSRLHYALNKLRENPHFIWLISLINFNDFQ